MTRLRIAFIVPDLAGAELEAARAASAALDARGHLVELLRVRRVGSRSLERRGFPAESLGVPWVTLCLARRPFDVAHAFEPYGALAGLHWRRFGGGPTLLTVVRPPDRERLADRRGTLATWSRTLEGVDALVAGNDRAQEAVRVWLAREIPVVPTGDGAKYEALYRAALDA